MKFSINILNNMTDVNTEILVLYEEEEERAN